jgi:hypothetical protein
LFVVFTFDGVLGGTGRLNCNSNPCQLELNVYSDNPNYMNIIMEKVKVASEIMCTFHNIQIKTITHVQNKNNLGYSDIVIYDKSYEGIQFPYLKNKNNINNYGYYIGINSLNITDINIANKILEFLGKPLIMLERKCFNGINYDSYVIMI